MYGVRVYAFGKDGTPELPKCLPDAGSAAVHHLNLVPPARAAYHGMSHAELLIGLAASISDQKDGKAVESKPVPCLCQEWFPTIQGSIQPLLYSHQVTL